MVNESNSRTWATLAHVTALLGGGAGGLPAFLGPLIIFLVFRDKDPFVRQHAVASLNFQISILIYAAVSVVLFLVVIGIFLLIALGIAWLVLGIKGAIAASRGESFTYPFTINFVK